MVGMAQGKNFERIKNAWNSKDKDPETYKNQNVGNTNTITRNDFVFGGWNKVADNLKLPLVPLFKPSTVHKVNRHDVYEINAFLDVFLKTSDKKMNCFLALYLQLYLMAI